MQATLLLIVRAQKYVRVHVHPTPDDDPGQLHCRCLKYLTVCSEMCLYFHSATVRVSKKSYIPESHK